MVPWGESFQSAREACRTTPRRVAVDGWIIGGREVWVVVAARGEDVSDLLRTDLGKGAGEGLWVCRAVLENGEVILGRTDPACDPLLSELMIGEEGGRA